MSYNEYADNRSKDEEGGFQPVPTKGTDYSHRDDPFGDETNAEVKYRTMKWWHCGIVMIAETIALGILSLPKTLAILGLVPGVIIIVGLGALATYTGYVIGQFKLTYRHVHNMADAGEVLFGPIGREVLGFAQLVFLVFVMGSHVLTFSIMMNTLTNSATCTIVFMIVGMIISIICTLPRTLLNVSWLSLASFISIVAAVVVTMVGVGIQKPGKGQIDATTSPSFYTAFLAVTNIIFAYAGHAAFFSFISELKRPEEYPKALYLLQGIDISMYVLVAVVIYYYGGAGVSSPALGSAGPIISKVAYGVAIPTIVVAGVINGHVSVKYIYVRMFRGKNFMNQRSVKSYGAWVTITVVLWIFAWIIAEAIPVFSNLLGLITSLFASWFTYGLSGIFWLHMNRGRYFSSPRKMALFALNVCIVGIGAAICGLGLYASGKSIHDSSGNTPFSCKSNA